MELLLLVKLAIGCKDPDACLAVLRIAKLTPAMVIVSSAKQAFQWIVLSTVSREQIVQTQQPLANAILGLLM